MDNNNNKTTRRKRSDCKESEEITLLEYPPGPIQIYPSWNPTNRTEKPPYSYATIIGHAILTSKERKLTLNDIYVWITKNYPFYSNDTQGWQNSIRHNLSLHKSFVKIDRDLSSQNPPRKGCFWTIRPGRERHFIDNLQRPVHSIKRHNSLSQFVSASRRNQVSRRHSSNSILYDKATTTAGRFHPLLRTTTEIPSTEPNIIASSSDHLSSRSSSSLSGSPNYHELLCNVPESSSTSYNCYPEHSVTTNTTELFTEQHHTLYNHYNPSSCSSSSSSSSGQSVTYSTSSNSSQSHPPSLSSCDAYSTTTSSFGESHPALSYPIKSNYFISHGALKFNHHHHHHSNRNILLGPEDTFLQPPYHYHLNETKDYSENHDSTTSSFFIKDHQINSNNNHYSPFQR